MSASVLPIHFARIVVCLVFLSAALWSTQPAYSISEDCLSGKSACQIGERSYWILPPDDWDRASPIPVMLYFHGWGRQGNVPVNHQHIGAATREAGVLLVAPDGLGKSWDFWRPGSRDTDFAVRVLEDIEKRFAVDTTRFMVSGYSWGGSMAWRFACEAGNKVSVLISISGTLYDQTEHCDTGPVAIRHVHGLKDTVMDFPYGPNGEETGPVRLWQRINGCTITPDSTSQWTTSQAFTRYVWNGCASGKSVSLDVHSGGHWIAKGWLRAQLKDISN